jgi:molybdopterin-guanine dinucleotide biosynthesis protein A
LDRVIQALRPLVSGIVLVAQSPDLFAHLKWPVVVDIYPGVGTLGGLHAGLDAIHTAYGLVVGCDMPLLNTDLLRYMVSQACGYDVVMPRVGRYYEPLHALYARRCLPAIERSIQEGQRRIRHALADLRIRYIEESEIDRHDPDHLSFFNVNTPEELARARALVAPKPGRLEN